MAGSPQHTQTYDVAIVGAGPAGLSASVYASRYKLKNAVIGPEVGGYVGTTHLVEDYLGFLTVSGIELAETFAKHAQNYPDATLIQEKVVDIKKEGKVFKLKTWGDQEITARGLLLATGTEHTKLAVPGEDKFEGHGVSYCVTCDAAFFRGKTVGIVGGGDSGAKGALHLSDFAERVYWIHRRDKFRAEPIWVDRVKEKPNVTFVMENTVEGVLGEQVVTGLKLAKPFEGKDELKADGLFVEIGSHPDQTLTKMVGAEVDPDGNVHVNDHLRTSTEHVWAAGDNTTGSAEFRQISTAVAEGSIAAGDMYEYLNDARKDWHAKGPMVTD